ncbi:hypothetical protein [Sinomonas atrocyanea]
MYSDLRTRSVQEAGLLGLRQQDYNDFFARVGELTAFVRERSQTPATSAHDAAEARLGTWLDAQRAADRRGRLSAPAPWPCTGSWDVTGPTSTAYGVSGHRDG